MSDAREIIARLGLEPHPEGGWFRETWRAAPQGAGRSPGTCIYFLIEAGQRSHWHMVDADEVWLFHAGDPLLLSIADSEKADSENGPIRETTLGPDLLNGHSPHDVVPAGSWQAARPVADGNAGYSLVACVVVPGFQYEGFTLAAPGWRPMGHTAG